MQEINKENQINSASISLNSQRNGTVIVILKQVNDLFSLAIFKPDDLLGCEALLNKMHESGLDSLTILHIKP